MSLSAEEVREVQFPNAPIGRRGYAKHQVDEYLVRIANTFLNEDDLTAAEVHHVMFSKPLVGRRGYDERQVDHFLDRVESALANRTGVLTPSLPAARNSPETETQPPFARVTQTVSGPESKPLAIEYS